ncbi:MAG: hypothetical protein LBH80_07380 [Prevotellaceae bacterium]|jgi:hypothetical protein|nr:hypothetical protein [Prevotellaceae bacterium]
MKKFIITVAVLIFTGFAPVCGQQGLINKLSKELEKMNQQLDEFGKKLSEVDGIRLKETSATPPVLFILDNVGLGCLTFGMSFAELPEKCAGLYDRYEKVVIEDEMDGDYTLYDFYLGEEKMLTAPAYKNTISGITAYSTNVSTTEGVCPGMSISKILQLDGVDGSYHEGFGLIHKAYFIDFGGYESLTEQGEKAFNDAYLEGTDVKPVKGYFKANARVVSISMGE